MALMSKKAAGGRPKVPGGAADADASAVEVAIAHEPGAPYPSVAELGADVSASSRLATVNAIWPNTVGLELQSVGVPGAGAGGVPAQHSVPALSARGGSSTHPPGTGSGPSAGGSGSRSAECATTVHI